MKSLLVLFCLLLMPSGLFANEKADVARLDSLYAKVEDSVNATSFLRSIDEFYKISTELGYTRYEEWACLSYIYYYYMNYNKAEVLNWYARLEVLVEKSKDYPELFMGKYLKLRLYDLIGEQDSALAEMDSAYAEAHRLGNPFCESLSCLGFANIYLKTRQYQEALDMVHLAFPNGLPETWNTPVEILSLNILALIAQSQGDEISLRKYLGLLSDYLERDKTGRAILPPDYISFGYFVTEFNCYRLYALYYLKKGDLKEAKSYMDRINKLLENSSNMNLRLSKYSIYIEYYTATDSNDSVLMVLEKAIKVTEDMRSNALRLRFLRRKANILSSQGRDVESTPIYREIAHLQDSISKDSYARKIGEFNVQLKVKRIEKENERLATRKNTLYWGIFSLSLFCLFLIILFIVIHRMKRNMERVKRKAENSERLKSIFLANMNHEIRTPLNAITGFCDLLVDETDPETCEQYIEIIENNNELLNCLINDVVDITKIETGMITLSYSEIQLADLMKSMYNTFTVRMEDGVKLLLDPVADISIDTDKSRLVQVITNLLTNAMKHTLSGSIRLGCELDKDKETVRFYVTDTGKGIPESEQQNIFTRFVQGKDRKGGVGLGLALCRGLVTQMDGEIGVVSKLGAGSTFWFTLPYQSRD